MIGRLRSRGPPVLPQHSHFTPRRGSGKHPVHGVRNGTAFPISDCRRRHWDPDRRLARNIEIGMDATASTAARPDDILPARAGVA